MSQVRSHDTFPRPEGLPVWPEVMLTLSEEQLDGFIDLRVAIVGDPEDTIAQINRWEATGGDQMLLLRRRGAARNRADARADGQVRDPEFDSDPVHRTTGQRAAAEGAAVPA
jgi:hypothetical protein